MTKAEVAQLFQDYPYLQTIWTIGKDYYFQNPDPDGILVGVKDWTLEDTI